MLLLPPAPHSTVNAPEIFFCSSSSSSAARSWLIGLPTQIKDSGRGRGKVPVFHPSNVFLPFLSNFCSSFLPAAKPTGHRKVRVVVVGGLL